MMTDGFLSKLPPFGLVLLRLGMGVVFLLFSYYQFSAPSQWTGYVPSGVAAILGGNALLLVLLNAWFELIAGICLIVGFQVRTVALLLALHLFSIAFSIGLSPLGVRDFGLSVATLSIFFAGADIWSLDRIFKKRAHANEASAPRSYDSSASQPIRRI